MKKIILKKIKKLSKTLKDLRGLAFTMKSERGCNICEREINSL